MDGHVVRRLSRLRELPLPRVLRDLLWPDLPRAAGRLLRDPGRDRANDLPKLGSAGASSDLRGLSLRPVGVKLIRESGGRADLLADFLVDFLTCLPVRVTDVVVEQGAIPLDDYPGGPRPTSTVTVSGGGRVGRGENVAFKESEHAAFVARARDFLVRAGGMGGGPCGVGAVMSALPPEASRYERAALEAALIDLGLRQAGLGLGDLGGTDEAWLRVVVSFAPGAAPAGRIRRLRAAGYRGEMKVDVDPAWGPE